MKKSIKVGIERITDATSLINDGAIGVYLKIFIAKYYISIFSFVEL
jgi:hypothetical protein